MHKHSPTCAKEVTSHNVIAMVIAIFSKQNCDKKLHRVIAGQKATQVNCVYMRIQLSISSKPNGVFHYTTA